MIILFFACEEKAVVPQTKIPQQNFLPIKLYLNNPSLSSIRNISGATHLFNLGGYNGFLIFRETQNKFRVYDGNCPHQLKSDCSLLKIEGIQAVCGCDETAFSLYTGESLHKKKNTTPLVMYPSFYDVEKQTLLIRPR